MAKPARRTYTLEQKTALVAEVERLYRAGGRSYVAIARELGISDTSYHNWIAQGIKPTSAAAAVPAPATSKPRKIYTAAERDQLVAEVKRLHAAGQTVKEVCRAVGIGEKTFRVWRAQRRALPAMRPVEVTAVVPVASEALSLAPPQPTAPATLNLLAPGGYRVEGLSVESAAQLLRALA